MNCCGYYLPFVYVCLIYARRLIFRGSDNEKAVLCSDDKTYEVKEAETSNSLLLVPSLKLPEELPQTNQGDMIVDDKNVGSRFYLIQMAIFKQE